MVDKIRVTESKSGDFPSLGDPDGPKGGGGDGVGTDIASCIKGEGDVGNTSEKKVPGRSPRRREHQ